jgi:sulfoxide reductase heme-binding subunit YedZ
MDSQSRLSVIPKHLSKIKVLLLLIAFAPLFIMYADYRNGALGIDPLDSIIRATGRLSLLWLLITLTITPLRHLLTWLMVRIKAGYGKRTGDWNWIIKLRRMIGLLSAFYAALHLGIYFWLDQGAHIANALRDMLERPFLAVGMLAFLLLIPLTLTSTNNMMRLLRKNWRLLHRLIYLIALLSILHFVMLTKVGVYTPYPYMLALFVLLGWRVWFALIPPSHKIPDNGMETPPRMAQ